METPIGQALKSRGPSLWITTAISAAVVGADLALVATGRLTVQWLYLLTVVVILSSSAVALHRRNAASFGLRLSPLQGWVYWAKVTILLGAVFLVVLLVFAAVFLGLLQYQIPARYNYISHPSQVWPLFVLMCVVAPTTEEIVFRVAICPPITAWLGPKAAIAISGVTFAAVHALSGNPGPDNLLAGFILAWAFLKSGTLAVPMALHSLGNLCAFGYQVVHFYWYL